MPSDKATKTFRANEAVASYADLCLHALMDETIRRYAEGLRLERDDGCIITDSANGEWRTGAGYADGTKGIVVADDIDVPVAEQPPPPDGLTQAVADWVWKSVQTDPGSWGWSDEVISICIDVLSFRAAAEVAGVPRAGHEADELAWVNSSITAQAQKHQRELAAKIADERRLAEWDAGREDRAMAKYRAKQEQQERERLERERLEREQQEWASGYDDDDDDDPRSSVGQRTGRVSQQDNPSKRARDAIDATMADIDRAEQEKHRGPAEQVLVTPPRDLSAEELFEKFAVEAHQHPFTGTRLFYRKGLAQAFGRRTVKSLWEWENHDPPLLPKPRYWTGNYPVPGEFSWLYSKDEFVGLVSIGISEGVIRPPRGRGSKRQPARTDLGRRTFALWYDLPAPPEPS